MPKIERFEDVTCWQEARALTRAVYAVARAEPLASDFRLRNQLTGAAVSTMTNIAASPLPPGHDLPSRFIASS